MIKLRTYLLGSAFAVMAVAAFGEGGVTFNVKMPEGLTNAAGMFVQATGQFNGTKCTFTHPFQIASNQFVTNPASMSTNTSAQPTMTLNMDVNKLASQFKATNCETFKVNLNSGNYRGTVTLPMTWQNNEYVVGAPNETVELK